MGRKAARCDRAGMLGDIDSRKDSHPMKIERILRILVKLNFTELYDSNLSGLGPFNDIVISICFLSGETVQP